LKKQIVLAAGLAVLAAPAFASKARLAALGESTNGSFYINDNRNIFLNASEVLNHKDLVTYEWGAAQQTDSDGSSNAEGGIFRAHGNMVYGVQFGRVLEFNDNADDIADLAGAAAGDVLQATNALDLFVGGDAGIKWGVQLTYASAKDDTFTTSGADDEEAKSDVMDLRVGVSQGQWAAYLAYGITGKAETDALDAEVTRKSPFEVGGSWKWDAYTAFAQYSSSKYDVEVGANDESAEYSSMQLGVGRQDKLNDKATLFTKVSYVSSKTDEEDVGGTDSKTKALPVVVGLEYDAASWLALRGSITQNVIIGETETDGDKNTTQNSTDINTGASLKFGDLTVDGLIGTSGNNGTAGGGENGVLATDRLMTRVSMTYRF